MLHDFDFYKVRICYFTLVFEEGILQLQSVYRSLPYREASECVARPERLAVGVVYARLQLLTLLLRLLLLLRQRVGAGVLAVSVVAAGGRGRRRGQQHGQGGGGEKHGRDLARRHRGEH